MKKTFSKLFAVALAIAMLASMLVGIVPVSAAASVIGDVMVKVTPNTISDFAVYEIDTNFSTLNTSNNITINFPQGTDLSELLGSQIVFSDMTLGDMDNPVTSPQIDADALLVIFTMPISTNYGDDVKIKFNATPTSGIINPGSPGDYSLSVGVEGPAPAKDSMPYTISLQPSIYVYNALGNLVKTPMTLEDAFIYAKQDYTIKIGEGTYEEDGLAMDTGFEGITLEATGDLDATVIKGMEIWDHKVSISGITFKPSGPAYPGLDALEVYGNEVTVDGCAFTKGNPGMGEDIFINFGEDLTVKNCSFDTTAGSVTDYAFIMADYESATTYATLDTCTFTLDQSTGLKGDIAILMGDSLTGGGDPPGVLTVMKCIFTGSSGIGYWDPSGSGGVQFRNNTFTSLESAFVIDSAGADVKIEANTITGCTKDKAGAIEIGAAAKVKIINNVIKDNTGYSVLSDDSTNVWVVGNQFSNNAMGMNSKNSLRAPLNYWDSADGPTAAVGPPAGDTIANSEGKIKATPPDYPFLSVAPLAVEFGTPNPDDEINLNYHPGTSLTVTGWYNDAAGNDDFIAGIKLSAKPPALAEPPYPAIAYFDIYNGGKTSTADIQVKLYGAGIASNTKAFYFSALTGNWVQCYPTAVAANGTYVQFSVKVADPDVKGYTPLVEDLSGTVFALVQGDPAQPASFDITAPDQGSTTAQSNVAFAWTPYPNATGYQFVLSKSFDLSAPIVKQDLAGVSTTAYIYSGAPLAAGSYYWQVMAYKNNAVVAKSSLGTFVAAAPAAPPPPTQPAPVTTFTLPAPTTLTVTQPAPTTYTIETPPAEQITPAWIWVLIAIGAVLVIVVVVLIVRTRRTA